MSRSLFDWLKLRLVAFRTRPPPDDPDRILVGLCRELTVTVHALQVLLENDKRDTDEIPGFDDLADREHALIVQIIGIPATGFAGLLSKAQVARLRPEVSGYDGAIPLALSLADDVIRLAATARNKT